MSDSHNPPRIAVLSGGVGPERDVSINSGSALADALESFYPVDLIDVKERKLPRELDPERHVVFSIIHGRLARTDPCKQCLRKVVLVMPVAIPPVAVFVCTKVIARIRSGITGAYGFGFSLSESKGGFCFIRY